MLTCAGGLVFLRCNLDNDFIDFVQELPYFRSWRDEVGLAENASCILRCSMFCFIKRVRHRGYSSSLAQSPVDAYVLLAAAAVATQSSAVGFACSEFLIIRAICAHPCLI